MKVTLLGDSIRQQYAPLVKELLGEERGAVAVTLKDIPAEKFRIYAVNEVTAITVNGESKAFSKKDTYYLV